MHHMEWSSSKKNCRVAAPKPKTHWRLIIIPILTLWVVAYFYVQHSDYKSEATIMLPILMGIAAFAVLLINAIVGSHQARRLILQAIDESVRRCSECNRGDISLYALEIHSYAFAFWFIQFNHRGKFCADCARKLVKRAFWKTFLYSILFPPCILWAWFEKRSILARLAAGEDQNAQAPHVTSL